MPTIDEKRVYSATAGTTPVYVASGLGVVVASVSGDIVGEFSVDCRCEARDVATAGDLLAVATDEDVLLGSDYAETGFGPAAAVGIHQGTVLAAAPDGRVGRYAGESWEQLGEVDDPRAVDGPLVAAADGVHRVVGDELRHAGLSDVRDAAGHGVPLAATAEGLYYLGNGWMDVTSEPRSGSNGRSAERSSADRSSGQVPREDGETANGDGGFRVVDSDGGRAHAVADDGSVLGGPPTGDWDTADLDVEGVVGFAYGEGLVAAVTADGELFVQAEGEGGDAEGWRSRALGVRGVGGVSIP